MLVSILIMAIAAGTANPPVLPRIFMTSVSGSGKLSTWPEAHGFSGLEAADEICRTRAAIASIADSQDYIALLSDSADDAYCRVHGLHGKRDALCGADTLPADAGPWYRMDGLAEMDVVDESMTLPQAGYVPRPIVFDEFGSALPALPLEAESAFTATTFDGTLSNVDSTCEDWTTDSAQNGVDLGSAYRGYGNFLEAIWTCDHSLRLICLEQGHPGQRLSRGPAPSARTVFATSTAGVGDLSSWADAAGATGTEAGDNICRAHAARAGLPLPETYKAWLSASGVDAASRFGFDGPWYRVDGVRIASSIADLIDGLLDAPIQIDESLHPLIFESVWTGTLDNGTFSEQTCSDWSNGTDASFGNAGRVDEADSIWTNLPFGIALGCSTEGRLYCLGDNDSLYLSGFDR